MFSRLINFFKNSSSYKRYSYKKLYPLAHINKSSNVRNSGKGLIFFDQKTIIDKNCEIFNENSGTISFGRECYVGANSIISTTSKIEVGDYTSFQVNSTLLGEVKIGSYCILAPNLFISSGGHVFKQNPPHLIRNQDENKAYSNTDKVQIDEDCWVGINVVVMPGITIGRGAIIGSNSVVNKNVAPYSIFAGVPAKKIGERLSFDPPSKILYSEDLHLPYFYEGFLTLQDVLESSRKLLGLRHKTNIQLCLKTSNVRKLKLKYVDRFAPKAIVFKGKEFQVQNLVAEIDISDMEDSQFTFFKLHILGELESYLLSSAETI